MSNFLLKDRPTLTCMIQAHTPERVLELIDKGLNGGADAFGLQLEQLERKYHTTEIFTELIAAMKDRPAYVTNYRYQQNEGTDEEILLDELLEISAMGKTLIDIPGDTYKLSELELATDEDIIKRQKELIDKIHKNGSEVLMSSHIFKFLPFDEVMNVALAHKERNADISKIVTGAETESELYSNFATTARLKNELGLPFLFLCGGNECRLHRRVAPVIANSMYLCVAEHDELSTPTQPLLSEAKEIIKVVL